MHLETHAQTQPLWCAIWWYFDWMGIYNPCPAIPFLAFYLPHKSVRKHTQEQFIELFVIATVGSNLAVNHWRSSWGKCVEGRLSYAKHYLEATKLRGTKKHRSSFKKTAVSAKKGPPKEQGWWWLGKSLVWLHNSIICTRKFTQSSIYLKTRGF